MHRRTLLLSDDADRSLLNTHGPRLVTVQRKTAAGVASCHYGGHRNLRGINAIVAMQLLASHVVRPKGPVRYLLRLTGATAEYGCTENSITSQTKSRNLVQIIILACIYIISNSTSSDPHPLSNRSITVHSSILTLSPSAGDSQQLISCVHIPISSYSSHTIFMLAMLTWHASKPRPRKESGRPLLGQGGDETPMSSRRVLLTQQQFHIADQSITSR